MQNNARLTELMNAAKNSKGSAEGQFEKTLDSLEAKVNKLRDAWEEFLMGIANSDLIKGSIDLLTKLLEVINKLTKGTGGLDSALMKLAVVGTALQLGGGLLQGGLGYFNARRYAVQAKGMAKANVDPNTIKAVSNGFTGNEDIGSFMSYLGGGLANFGNLGFVGMAKDLVKNLFINLKGIFTNSNVLSETAAKELTKNMSSFFLKINPKMPANVLTESIANGMKYTKAAGIWTQFASGAKAGNALGDVGVALKTVGVEAGGAASGMAKFGAVVGALGPGLAVLAGTLATIGIAKGIVYLTSAQKELDDINKKIAETDERLSITKDNVDALMGFEESSNSLKDQLSQLTRGTAEFNQKLIESNQLVLDLLKRYPMLKLGKTGIYGELTIDKDSLETLQTVESQGYTNLQNSKIWLQNEQSVAQAKTVLEEFQDIYTYRISSSIAENKTQGFKSNSQLRLSDEWEKYINDDKSSADFATWLMGKKTIDRQYQDQIRQAAIDYQNAQINLNSAQENAKGQKIEVYISQQEDLTDDQRQRIRNRAALLQTATTELDTEKSSFKKDLQNIYKDAEGNPIFGYYDTWEAIYKKVFGVENLPSAFKKEDGSVDNEAIRNALATEAATKQIGILNDNLDKVIDGINGKPGLRNTDSAMADRLERAASGSLTQDDIDWFSENKNSDNMKTISEQLGFKNVDDFYSKYLQGVIDNSKLLLTEAQTAYKKITGQDWSTDTIGKNLGAAVAKAYTDVLEQAYVRQGNLGINNIQGFITGIAGNDSEKITQVIQALSQVNDLGDTDQIESLFKSLEALGLFAGKSRKEIQNLKNSFISVNNAIRKLDFDQLKEKISSIGQLVNKINLGEQDNIFSKEDMDLITGLNPDLENDFYENLDGSFTYLGGSMDNLASVLQANTAALLKESLDQAKTGITLASAFESEKIKLADKEADKGQWLNETVEAISKMADGANILNQLGLNTFTDYASDISDETVANLYAKVAGYSGSMDYWKEQYRETSLRMNGINMQAKGAWDLYNIGQDKTLGGYIKNGIITNADDAKTYANTYLNALIAKNKDYGLKYGSTLQAYAQQAQNVDWTNASSALNFMSQLTSVAKEIAQTYGEINGRALQEQIGTSKTIIEDKTEAANKRQAQYSEIATAASTYYGTAVSADFVEKYWDQFKKILDGGDIAEKAASAIRQLLIDTGAMVENEVKPEDFADKVEQEIKDIQENGTKPVVSVDGDTTDLENKTNEATNNINGQEANINVDANTEEAEGKIENLTAKELFTNLEVSLDGAETAEEKIKALAQWISNLTDIPLSFTITGQANLTDIVTKFNDLMTQISELVTAVNNMSSGVMTTAAEIEGRFEQLAATLSLVTEIVDEPDAQVTYTGVSTTALPNGDVIAGPGNQYIMKVPQFKVNVKKNENAGNGSGRGSSGGSKGGSKSGSKGGSSRGSYKTIKNDAQDRERERDKKEAAKAARAEEQRLNTQKWMEENRKKWSSPSTDTSKRTNETNPTQGPTDTDIAKAPTTTTETSRDNNFTNPKDVGNFGKNKGTGSGSGSGSKDSPSSNDEDKWENSYDWLYNLTQDINAELEKREKLELKYNNILKDRNKTAKELYQNAKAQLDSLEKSRNLNAEAYEKRKAELQLEAKQATAQYTNDTRFNMKWGTGLASGKGSSSGLHVINLAGSSGGGSEDTKKDQGKRTMLSEAELGRYATFNWDDNTVEINWDAVNQITDQQKGEAVEDYISKLEEIQEKMNEAEKSLLEIDGKIREIIDQGKDEFKDFEQQIFDALVSRYQKEIDKLTEISEAITDANSKLIDSMTNAIDKEREARDNEKTETELADKQKQLDYLRSDTSNANAKQILDLEKELAEGQEDYTDQLIDQKIDELKEQNDKASEQRQVQIDLMTKNLEMAQETGALWQEVYNLMDVGVDQEGALVKQSELFDLLQSEAGWQGMSAVSKMTWLDELTETVKAGMAYLMTGRQLEYIGAEAGKQITFSAYDEQGKLQWLTGTVDKNGDVVDSNGVRYSEIFQNYDGSFTTMETAGVGTKKEPPKPAQKPANPINSNRSPSRTYDDHNTDVWHISGNTKDNGLNLDSNGNLTGTGSWNYNDKHPFVYGGNSDEPSNSQMRAARDLVNPGQYDKDNSGTLTRQELEKGLRDQKINWDDPKYQMEYDKTWDPYYKKFKYKTGGLNTQTGPAWLDGTFAKPELVLNSKDTANFLELRDLLRALQISIKSPHRDLTDNNKNNGDNYYEIDINVESIADDYDVAKMADKIKKLISQDALYRNGNAINRLR